MASKLFEAFNNTQGKSGKFGYTLTSSVNAMNALMAAKQKIEEVQGSSGGNFFDVGGGGGDEDEGGLLSNTLSGYYDNDGFVENGYSAQVNVKNYGAFVISKDTDEGEKNALVAVEIGNDQIQNGIDCSGNKRFLANVNNDFKSYNGLKNFVYGFAIDVAQFGVPFFYKYYPSLDLNYTQICKLIENNCLCATIKFNNTEITALVTLDYYRGTGAHRDVFVPNILLMQDNSKVGVYVSVDDATPVAVGSGDVQNPFSLLIYDNDTGEVSFGPEEVSSLVQNSTLAVKYSGCSLTNTKGDMRLFLNYDKKSKAEQIIGVPISQEVEDRLFNLVEDEIEQGKPAAYDGRYTRVNEYWEKLGQEVGLSWDQVEAAVGVVAKKESGGDWGMWKECKVRVRQGNKTVLKGDGQGISAGYLQFTQVAGGIKDYRNFYVKLQANDNTAPEMSRQMYNDIETYNEQNYPSALLKHKTEFENQSKHEVGRLAQLLAWEGEKENRVKRTATIKWFKKFNCSTAAEFKAIFGAVNHLPNYFDKTGFPKFQSYITNDMQPIEKAKMLEKIHFAGHKDYYKGRSSVQTPYPNEINSNTIGGTYRYRYNSVMQLFGDNNVNLDGWEKMDR